MRVAYLVAAHHQAEQCRRLLRRIASPACHVFVHVDVRADQQQFHLESPWVRFVRRRRRVNRGGWSLSLAMKDLLHAAFASGEYDYFAFLSGSDYPIRNEREIFSFLEQHAPCSFMNYRPLVAGAQGTWNLTRYHFVDWSVRLHEFLEAGHDPGARRDPFPRLVDLLNGRLPERAFPPDTLPFIGWNRWFLQRDTVRHILETWSSPAGRRLRRYFRFTWGSDEMIFQTLVLNSHLAARCVRYDADAVRAMFEGNPGPWLALDVDAAYPHYVDWNPAREDPAILDERDFEALHSSPALFAYKFVTPVSDTLLERIDRELLGRDGR